MKRLVVAVTLSCAAGPAIAGGAGQPVIEPPVVAAPDPVARSFDWSGFYLGAAITSSDVGGIIDGTDVGTEGFGIQAGYLRDFGTLIVGGELAYVDAEFDDDDDVTLTSTRLKLIGGLNAGRFMPYAFVGASDMELGLGGASANDTGTNYGLGGRVALGANGNFVAGVEYLIEEVDDFNGSDVDIENDDLSLRFDYRF